jgi:UDP-N-acetylmuramoylalanine--D-glutamate ligase
MFDAWRAAGGEIAVIGLGRSGAAVTRLLRAEHLPVYASDAAQSEELEAVAAELRALGATVDLAGHDLARIRRAGGVVLSPGVPPDAPPVAAAREAGVEVRAEMDIGLEALAGTPYIGVTGTNGKSTVTALIAHLLRAAGHDGEAAGNIGTPLTALARQEHRAAWLAVEFSSFQLHDCPRVAPVVGVLTNLSADHLDRYPTLDAYYADKRLFFRNAGEDAIWISNADDPDSQAMLAGVPGRHYRFSVAGRADGWYDRERDALVVRDRIVIVRTGLGLLGDHNVANALAASLALAVIGTGTAFIANGLRSFRALAHRLEPVGEVNDVLWVNDSKATNLASTEVAVAAMDRPCVLLLGGRHKGEPYTRLAPLLAARCRAVVAYGEAGDLVEADLRDVVPVVRAGGFEEVLAAARRLAEPGDAVLLSPACSSYDMFRNYGERGAAFRAWVEAL